jgi:hypothetical protein
MSISNTVTFCRVVTKYLQASSQRAVSLCSHPCRPVSTENAAANLEERGGRRERRVAVMRINETGKNQIAHDIVYCIVNSIRIKVDEKQVL